MLAPVIDLADSERNRTLHAACTRRAAAVRAPALDPARWAVTACMERHTGHTATARVKDADAACYRRSSSPGRVCAPECETALGCDAQRARDWPEGPWLSRNEYVVSALWVLSESPASGHKWSHVVTSGQRCALGPPRWQQFRTSHNYIDCTGGSTSTPVDTYTEYVAAEVDARSLVCVTQAAR